MNEKQETPVNKTANQNHPWKPAYTKRPSALPYEDKTGAVAAARADKEVPWSY